MIRSVRLLLIALTIGSATVAHADNEPFLGEINITASPYCPKSFVQAAGQVLSINQNQALYSILGATYGGNGSTTFALPKMKLTYDANGNTLLPCIASSGIYPTRP